MTRTLRDYQLEAADSLDVAWAGGMLRPAIVLPTGCGKTDVIAKKATDAAERGLRVLALAHRGELLDQIAERCLMHAPHIPVGRVQAGKNEVRRPIIVASAQTLASEKRRAKMVPPDLVIVDECHHAASPSQMAILQWAGSFDRTPTMGVTATMTRGDKRGLGDVWQEVVFQRDIKWAIDSGWLVEPRGRAVVTDHMDLNAAKVSKGDYQDGELGEMVAQDVDQIVKAWLEHAHDRITVAFTPSVESGQALAEEFRAQGIACGEVYGSTPRTERAATYKALEAGEVRVLVSVMVTTEGWDCPPVSCILMARPTRLPGLYTQIVGRGLRPSPGKSDCLVLDVVGASRFQRLVTLVDLHPTAEYSTAELDALPCDECGGWTNGGEPTCTCEAEEPAERDPDGGRIRLLGPARYDDIDMFAGSGLNWLFTRGGLRFLPAGERMAVLWPDSNDPAQGAAGTYTAGHCTVRGYEGGRYVGRDGVWIDDGVPHTLGAARELAEAWALAHDPSVASRSASWRQRGGSPSDKQVSYARGLGVVDPERMNKARLSDEISIALASQVLDG